MSHGYLLLLWAEHKFNGDSSITDLRKAEKMSMTMPVLVERPHQQSMKTLKHWRKWFWIIVKSLLERLLSFSSCQAIFTDVLDMKRTTAKIVPKTMLHGHIVGYHTVGLKGVNITFFTFFLFLILKFFNFYFKNK